jgi:hypothetical protein
MDRPRLNAGVGVELRNTESMLARLGGWIEEHNRQVPHFRRSVCGPPGEYRASPELTPSICVGPWGVDHAGRRRPGLGRVNGTGSRLVD